MQAKAHLAARRGDLKTLRLLHAQHDLTKLLNPNHENVLFSAVRFRKLQVVKFLLKHCPALAELIADSSNVLEVAIQTRSTPIVSQLLKFSTELTRYFHSLKQAIELDYEDGVILLVTYDWRTIYDMTNDHENILHIAAESTNLVILRCLLNVCPSDFLRGQTSEGQTPFAIAVAENNVDVAKLLFDPDAVNMCNCAEYTPLFTAMNNRCDEIVRYILQKCPDAIHQKDCSGANVLCRSHGMSTVQMLLDLKPSLIDEVNDSCWNVLQRAVVNGSDECVIAFLLQRKPDLMLHRNNVAKTALELASEIGCTHCVHAILDFKSDVDDIDSSGDNTLHMAVQTGDQSLIERVFAHCTRNLQLQNNSGETPMHIAVSASNVAAAQLFSSHLTLETAVEMHDECLFKCKLDLKARFATHCHDTLKNNLVSDLTQLVLQYTGLSTYFFNCTVEK